MGSLVAGMQKLPLSREQYLMEKRSNVSAKTMEGIETRHSVYDEYEKYDRWKKDNKKVDFNDVVLRILKANPMHIFSSGKNRKFAYNSKNVLNNFLPLQRIWTKCKIFHMQRSF